MKQYNFPTDHFGVLTDALIQKVLNPVGDKRKRKTAVHALAQIIKLSGQVSKGETFKYGGVLVDAAGQIFISVFMEEALADKVTKHFGKGKHLFVPDHTETRGAGICFYCDNPIEHEVHQR